MSTLSVPLTPEMEKFINDQVKSGKSANKAAVVRRAILAMEEEEAVDAVLKASREPNIKGDLRDLMKKIR